MWKKIVAIFLVLTAVLSFTACEENGAEKEAGLPSAEEIIAGVLEAQDEIHSSEFSMSMSMDASGEFIGQPFDMTMEMNVSAKIMAKPGM